MTQMNNMQHNEFHQKQIMMMGGVLNTEQKKLSPETIQQMKKDYIKMYYAFTSINWGMGKTLGVSWQKALEQMDGFVAAKAKIPGHPANTELLKIHQEFRRDLARAIMNNPYVTEKLAERLKKNFIDYGTEAFKQAKSAFDNVYKQYMPNTKLDNAISATKPFGISNQQTQQLVQQILMQQMARQRAA